MLKVKGVENYESKINIKESFCSNFKKEEN